MPIKGLSEERRLPRAGKIRLGIKKTSQSGNLYPSATDYFVVNVDKATSAAAAKAFKEAYGETPRSLDIILPHVADSLETLKEVLFPQYYKQYGSGTGLKCKGDGEKAERMELDAKTGLVSKQQIVCPGPELCPLVKKMSDGSGGVKMDCGPVAHLQVFLPKVNFLGIWQIDTGSENSIRGINSDLQMIHDVVGTVANLPLKMGLMPREVSPNGKKKTIYVVTITCPASLRELKGLRENKQAFLVDLIDDEEIPTDLRPIEALQPHPMLAHLPAPAAHQPAPLPAGRPAPASASAAAQETEEVLDDPIENGIRFHAWRIGMTDLQRETARTLHRDPAKYLTALQRTDTPTLRAEALFHLGYAADGHNLKTGEAGGPHVVVPTKGGS